MLYFGFNLFRGDELIVLVPDIDVCDVYTKYTLLLVSDKNE